MALFGLEATLVDKAGTYRDQTPIDVFHSPITDEKDTERYEGFDPDGNPITMPFSMDGFKREDPFSYVSQDEDFFSKPENFVTTATASGSPRVRSTLFSGFDPMLNLLVKPTLAHPVTRSPIVTTKSRST